MDAKNFALELRDTFLGLQNKGVTTLQTEKVVAYLNEAIASMDRLPSQPSTADTELYKAKLQKWIEEQKNVQSHQVEMFRAVISAGQNALRSAFLMNGGGAVAVLAFIGNLANNDPQRIPSLAPSLTVFVSGVLLVAVASGATYFSQWFYAHLPKWGSAQGTRSTSSPSCSRSHLTAHSRGVYMMRIRSSQATGGRSETHHPAFDGHPTSANPKLFGF